MRWLLPLVLLGCSLLYSCNKEEENYVEEIVMTNVFYEDFFDIDNINFVADSLYFINSEEKFKQIKDKIPSIYTKISKTDFNRNTIIITAARQDYNIFTYEVKLFFNTMSKTCNLFINYVLLHSEVQHRRANKRKNKQNTRSHSRVRVLVSLTLTPSCYDSFMLQYLL